jgi:hypothetical protein
MDDGKVRSCFTRNFAKKNILFFQTSFAKKNILSSNQSLPKPR